MELFILSFNGNVWSTKRRIFGEEREFSHLYLSSVFFVSETWWVAAYWWLKFGCRPWGAYSINEKEKESTVYARGISSDYGWVALTVKSIVAMGRHFKEEARRKAKRMYDMQRMNGNEKR